METILTNARVVGPASAFSGTVVVAGRLIADVGEGVSGQAGAEDLEGDLLIPGLIDLHTDNLEKYFNPRPRVIWDHVSAVMGHDVQVAGAGITTVYDSLSLNTEKEGSQRQAILEPMLRRLRETAEHTRAEHLLHLRCEVTDPCLPDLMTPFIGDRAVRLLSVMDHTPGQRQFAEVHHWWTWHRSHNESRESEMAAIMERRLDLQSTYADRYRRYVADIAGRFDIPVASHDDATEDHIAEAAALGVRIAEFPTTLEAARAAANSGMAVLMGAPNLVRGGSHSGNVSAGELAEAGVLDILASDYIPGSMIQAAFALTEAPWGYSLPEAIATVTSKPARAAGLRDRGAIMPTLRADLVRVGLIGNTPIVKAVWRGGQRVI